MVALQELQQQLAAEKEKMVLEQQEQLQHFRELQSKLEAQHGELAREKAAGTAAAAKAASFEAELEKAGHAASAVQGFLIAEPAGSSATGACS